jgi:iron complex outermembrane receptor protein
MVKAGMVIPLVSHKVFGGIEEQYVDRRRTEGGGYASSFFTTNLTVVARNILPRLDASFSVYDLFDKEFSDPVSLKDLSPLDTVRQDGRNYRIKLTYAF